MKTMKKAGLLLFGLSLVLAFAAGAWADDRFVTMQEQYKALNIQTPTLADLREMYSGDDVKPREMPRRQGPIPTFQGIEPHVGIPLEEHRHPGKIPADATINTSANDEALFQGLDPQWLLKCPPSPFVQVFDTDYTAFPARAIGKLHMTDHTGATGWCTATLVDRNLIMTAGHCVGEDGFWFTNFEFVPGYYYGPTLYGSWEVFNGTTFNAWLDRGDSRYDVAFLVLSPQNGLYPSDVVGGYLGFAAGLDPRYLVWDQYGYPYNLADGYALSRVTSGFGTYDYSYSTNRPVGVGSNMQQGSSGGSWVFADVYGLWVNGINDYGYNACDYNMFGAYFGNEVWDLFESGQKLQ